MTDHDHPWTYIGTTTRGLDVHAPLAIDDEVRRRHVHIVGQTGSGKSTLILNMLAQDFAAGHGLALLDPHGDLAQRALAYIPARRAHHLTYLNPSDLERPIGLNVLDRVPTDLRATAADGVVAAFKHVWLDSWGPRLEYILLHAVRALMDAPGSTLLGLPRLLIDDAYRARVVSYVRDPIVRSFWRDEYNTYDARFRAEAIAPIQNKIGRVLAAPALRNIIAQPASTIDLRRIMDEGRILIANLSKGALGEGAAHLLGALIVTAIAQAALSRADTPEHKRRVFYLYADEFQNYATESFGIILSEARKYALALTVGHQYLGQLPETLRHAVLGNAGSFISFRVGAEDGPLLARHLGLASDTPLKDLPNFAARGRFLINAVPTEPLLIDMPPAPPPIHHRPDKLIVNSRVRFGRDRAAVEGKIARFLGATARTKLRIHHRERQRVKFASSG